MKIKCGSCNTITSIDTGDFEYQEETEERPMGKHTEHWGKYEFECSNSKCSKEITVETNTTEYPVDNFEEGETSVSGGELI